MNYHITLFVLYSKNRLKQQQISNEYVTLKCHTSRYVTKNNNWPVMLCVRNIFSIYLFLQKQVCSHIVTAIKKESLRLKDDWEIHLCSGGLENAADPSASDTYCFEMMSLVLALSGSAVGRSHLASQYNFIKDLLSLLHTASGRIQR